jgi:hypothetical protein
MPPSPIQQAALAELALSRWPLTASLSALGFDGANVGASANAVDRPNPPLRGHRTLAARSAGLIQAFLCTGGLTQWSLRTRRVHKGRKVVLLEFDSKFGGHAARGRIKWLSPNSCQRYPSRIASV